MRSLLLVTALLLALPPVHTAIAADSDSQPVESPRDADYENGRKAIEAKNWKLAIEQLGRAAARNPDNPDIHNYLGYANRKFGNLDAAFRSYRVALRLDPKHKGAHEYVGEAYLMVNNLAKAEEHLAALDGICFLPCEEYTDLKKEIQEYKQQHAKK